MGNTCFIFFAIFASALRQSSCYNRLIEISLLNFCSTIGTNLYTIRLQYQTITYLVTLPNHAQPYFTEVPFHITLSENSIRRLYK